MANTIIMSKYQGLGNDYLILDPKRNRVQLQRKLPFSAREDSDWEQTACSMDR